MSSEAGKVPRDRGGYIVVHRYEAVAIYHKNVIRSIILELAEDHVYGHDCHAEDEDDQAGHLDQIAVDG